MEKPFFRLASYYWLNLSSRISSLSMSTSDATLLKDAWVHPGVLSVLTLIGPDVIQRALAQLSGHRFTPVAFSFGWVAYSFNSLVLAVGNNKLMPEPDFSSIVINGKTGYSRDNHSWILGRILRDFEHWKPQEVGLRLDEMLKSASQKSNAGSPQDNKPVVAPRTKAGLCVSIFRADPNRASGVPAADWIYYSGVATAVVQLIIAVIPLILHDDWVVLLTTSVGIVLAFATGWLPQWGMEKWGYPRVAKTAILTRGNGAQHAIVIIGDKNSLDLEALACADPKGSMWTRFFTISLAVLWIAHLITVVNIQQDPWFLMLVGGIGMMHNVMVAGLPRTPEAFGVPLVFEECILDRKVMQTLMKVEERHPRLGASMLQTFFPGKLYPDEEAFWERKAQEADKQDAAEKAAKKAAVVQGPPISSPTIITSSSAIGLV
ncbi:hypothetical protein M404DRAFT_999111 [Pisolithus tinctorius Marx 270]|uniref:Uncharacterized protein n=1 Tax=Pisolithus tinctorius Marx 270 TaxID=870435 RepID=A0A0C3JBJ0_PISTI|nr:hypothetical protein M404DRAFT_999111 [Pisolithus tinctorius Marx 270]